jgi:hypothetical protein
MLLAPSPSEVGAVIHVAAGTYSTPTTCAADGLIYDICVTSGGSSPSVRLRIQCDTPLGCLLRGTPDGYVENGTNVNNFDIVGFDMGGNTNAWVAIKRFCNCPLATGSVCPGGNSVHIIGNYVHDMGQTATINTSAGAGVNRLDVPLTRRSIRGNMAISSTTGK